MPARSGSSGDAVAAVVGSRRPPSTRSSSRHLIDGYAGVEPTATCNHPTPVPAARAL